MVEELVARNQPFLIEKPVSVDAPSLLNAMQYAEASQTFAAVAFINRYSPFWTELGVRRAAGEPVRADVARFRIVNGSPNRYVNDDVQWVLDPQVSGGGAMRNIGAHTVDAFLMLAEGKVTVEGAVTSHRQYSLAIEDHTIALLRDEAGLIGIVEAGYTRPDADGTDHEWMLAGPGFSMRDRLDNLEIVDVEKQTIQPTPTVMERYKMCAADTIDRLDRGLPPAAGLRDAWRAATVIDEIYRVATDPQSNQYIEELVQ
jgi:predicted dehydrogenase